MKTLLRTILFFIGLSGSVKLEAMILTPDQIKQRSQEATDTGQTEMLLREVHEYYPTNNELIRTIYRAQLILQAREAETTPEMIAIITAATRHFPGDADLMQTLVEIRNQKGI